MFYSQHVLTKKGPLAKIWLAAHMQGKLTKAMIFSTDIQKAVNTILTPDVPMALRLTSNLLLGVVRILHRKTKYLLQESSDAMTKLKLTFRPATQERSTANYNAITINHSIDLADLPARIEPTQGAFLAADRDITIDQFAGGLSGGMLDAFAMEPEIDRDRELALDAEPLLFTPSQRKGTPNSGGSVRSLPSVEVLRADDGDDAVVPEPVLHITPTPERRDADVDNAPDNDTETLRAEPKTPERPTSPQIMIPDVEDENVPEGRLSTPNFQLDEPSQSQGDAATQSQYDDLPQSQLEDATQSQIEEPSQSQPVPSQEERLSTGGFELIEEEGQEAPRKRKRKALMTDDGPTELSATDFRACLMDTSDLLRRPRQRRRVVAPLRYEEVIARPAIELPPQLRGLFAQSFRVDQLVVASPISDADLGDETEKDKEKDDSPLKEVEEEGSLRLATPTPSVPMPETPPMEGIEDERRDTITPIEPPKEVSIDPDSVFAEETADNAPMSESVPLPEETPAPVEDLYESTEPWNADRSEDKRPRLRDVAETAAQVDGADVDVAEATVSARTKRMQEVMDVHMEGNEFHFTEMLHGERRRTAARCFYELLNLSSKKAVSLRQEEAYGDIWVTPVQPTFDSLRSS